MNPTVPSGLRPRERFVLLAALSYVLMTVLAGPLRMYLSFADLAPLIYLPNFLLSLAIGWQLLADSCEQGFTPMKLIAVVIPFFALMVGLQFTSAVQAATGMYVLLPFWFGLVCGPVLLDRWRAVGRIVPLLWLVVVTGVLANQVFEYPWEGFGYNLGELDVEGSRQWYAQGGVKRLAGFARASFDAAVQVQIAGILLVLQTRGWFLRLLVWALTFAAIIPTNSKGILLVAVVLTPIVLLRRALPESPLRVLPIFFGSIGLALPISTLLFTFNSPLRDPALANATFSLYDRLNDMWPAAWDLLREQGQILMGRGIGGVGTAQTYFEPDLFNAGDNLFMYWFVVFGWLALPGFLLVLARSLRLRPHRDAVEMRIYCLLLAILVYGAMANIVENALSALACGLVVRCVCTTPTARRSRAPVSHDAGAGPILACPGDIHVHN
jgi:hypothetical protein